MDFGIKNSSHLRIAIYSQDGQGLGHMRRTSNIAWKIFQMQPDICILTLSDSKLGQFFETSPKHDYLKLPSIVKVGPGDWRATNLSMSSEEIFTMRKDLIRSTLLSFAPDIFLVDHMPHGAMGELIPGLEALQENDIPTKVVLGLRDILDAPEVIEKRWQEEGAFEAIERFYSRVLIYGMREVFSVAEKYHFSDALANIVRYCGYICSPINHNRKPNLRAQYLAGTPAGTKFIVAMAGGGADAYPMMRAILDAMPLVEKHQRCVLVLITGPFMPVEMITEINQRAEHVPVHVIESVDNTLDYIAEADLVISMAGYNSCTEILQTRKPAILIPRSGPSAEQRTRAQLFAERQWMDSVDLDAMPPDQLAALITRRMNHTPVIHPLNRPNLLGVSVAANQILSLLSPELIGV
jgi:predicted glycosyltransferase